jgi:hypothetical protein
MDTPKRMGRPPKPRPPCAREGSTLIKKMRNPYCSKSCSNRARDLPSVEERYWANIGIYPDTPPGCRDWLRVRDKDGYGLFALTHSQQIVASRYGLELKLGRPLLPDMKALHTCDRPPCQEPTHLFEGTPKDNNDDMRAKGRQRYPGPINPARGTRQPAAKLTDDNVRQIKALRTQGWTQTALAERFGVNQKTIWAVLAGEAWKHVE